MKIFVISLARSVDRRAQMLDKLTKADIAFTFFDAVDASVEGFPLSERAAPDITKKRKGYTLLNSEIGCYASHFLLWQKCVEMNEPIVILEDNIDLSKEFKSILESSFLHASNFNYIKLSATITKNRKFNAKTQVNNQYSIGVYSKGTCGTTGYIISPVAAKNFIDKSKRFIEPVDDFMEKPWLHGIKAYSLNPAICYRADIQSTIGNARKVKFNTGLFDIVYIEAFRCYERVLRFFS